jgi:hypothetical protein
LYIHIYIIGGFNPPCEAGADGGVKEGITGQKVNEGSKIFSTTCDSISKFKDNENIAENILKLFLLSINTPSSSGHNKPILLALNILPLTVEIISAHPNNPEIIRLGCGLLLVLKYDNSTYRESLVRANQLNEQGKAAPKGSCHVWLKLCYTDIHSFMSAFANYRDRYVCSYLHVFIYAYL